MRAAALQRLQHGRHLRVAVELPVGVEQLLAQRRIDAADMLERIVERLFGKLPEIRVGPHQRPCPGIFELLGAPHLGEDLVVRPHIPRMAAHGRMHVEQRAVGVEDIGGMGHGGGILLWWRPRLADIGAGMSIGRLPLIRLPAPSPRKRGEGRDARASPRKGRRPSGKTSTPTPFSPLAGRRSRQRDEGQSPPQNRVITLIPRSVARSIAISAGTASSSPICRPISFCGASLPLSIIESMAS